jgi:hypothetical protein
LLQNITHILDHVSGPIESAIVIGHRILKGNIYLLFVLVGAAFQRGNEVRLVLFCVKGAARTDRAVVDDHVDVAQMLQML